MRLAAMLLVGLLAACAGPGGPSSTVVSVPVATRCVRDAPERPAFVQDDELQAMNDYQLVLALWRDRLVRIGYEAELEAVIAACRE